MRALTCLLSLALLAGCGVETKLVVARPGELPAEIEKSATPLLEAVARGRLLAYAMPGASTSEVLSLALEPKDTGEIWVRIDPGTEPHGVVEGAARYATYRTYYARLHREKVRVVSIPHVQLEFSAQRKIPERSVLRPMPERKVLRLLREVDAMEEPPDWGVLQLAVFVMTGDIPRTAITLRGLDGVDRRSRHKLALDVEQLLDAIQLVETQDLARRELTLWRDLQVELNEQLDAYDALADQQARGLVEAFERVARYYPLAPAREAVAGAFARHLGEGADLAIRRAAFATLRRFGGERELRLIGQLVPDEFHEGLRSEMEAVLQASSAAAPSR